MKTFFIWHVVKARQARVVTTTNCAVKSCNIYHIAHEMSRVQAALLRSATTMAILLTKKKGEMSKNSECTRSLKQTLLMTLHSPTSTPPLQCPAYSVSHPFLSLQ